MATAKSVQSTFQPDSDVHVSFEDQKKINKFAKQNAKLEDLQEEIKRKQHELQNLIDACSEMELLDDDTNISYHIGEIFVKQECTKTLQILEELKEQREKEIVVLQDKCNALKNVMSELKVELYAKFGNHISLDADED